MPLDQVVKPASLADPGVLPKPAKVIAVLLIVIGILGIFNLFQGFSAGLLIGLDGLVSTALILAAGWLILRAKLLGLYLVTVSFVFSLIRIPIFYALDSASIVFDQVYLVVDLIISLVILVYLWSIKSKLN